MFLAGLLAFAAARAGADTIAWEPWSDAAFARAKAEHKFVIMDLEAVWCHWCHVMDETTYKDPKVMSLMAAKYVAVKVDQDSRPDLANRYENYGWPATIVYAADGSEIVRRRGYLNPTEMAAMLQAIIDDPSPGPSVRPEKEHHYPTDVHPDDAVTAALRQSLISGYERADGGWSDEHKFLDAENVEYCLRAASRGDAEAAAIARDMLRLQGQIFDPVWGGAYQYSAEGDWVHPHFEKIMSIQADNLRIYSIAANLWPHWGYQRSAGEIRRYLLAFLKSPDGSYYTSQDADLVQGAHAADYFALDDAGRRARGVPRIDPHRYSRENGWVISALCTQSGATGDLAPIEDAVRAADWVVAHRALAGGGFMHDEHDAAGPFLGDTLAMGSAFLALYQSTGNAAWLSRAEAAADFIGAHFARGMEPGYATSDTTISSFPRPRPEFDESVALARFAIVLASASGKQSYRGLAESSLRWALSPDIVKARGPYVGGLLLAQEELRGDPLHVTVVGPKDDPSAKALFAAAQRAPTSYRLLEWWDKREGPPPRNEAIFPDLDHPAAYLCANGACSSPITDPAALSIRLGKSVASAGR
jgi:uncharacterized protein